MQDNLFGVIIKVGNIDRCRSFYRDILQLGAPVMDSNFWVEFKLPGSFSIFLEKNESVNTPNAGNENISWIYKTSDIDKMIERLKEYGFEPEEENSKRLGFKVCLFRDPEGNPFYLSSEFNKDELESIMTEEF